jgi:hypothetical protein
MHAARLIIVSFLLLAIVVTFSSQGREATSRAWEDMRPTVVEVMDGLYATIRSFVAGEDPHESIDDHAPGVNFDLIITLDHGVFL